MVDLSLNQTKSNQIYNGGFGIKPTMVDEPLNQAKLSQTNKYISSTKLN